MTTTIADEVSKRGRKKKAPGRATFVADLIDRAFAYLDASAGVVRFPSTRYQQDPVAFVREVLGVEPTAKQVEILEAVRDNSRVAVTSGHKVGKSATDAMVALWFYCSFPDARVVMTSTTSRQVDQILWRELRMLRARGGRCVDCKAADPDGHRIPRPCPHSSIIEGEQGELARTGLKSDDFREIVGFTAREAEAVAGISGKHLLYIADEASGIPEEIFEAIEGNRAGGAKLLLTSNPTRNDGEFYRAFHDPKKSKFYKTIRISSEESPNVIAGREIIPGMATLEWLKEKREEWGEDSATYKIRVKGEFALNEEGKIFSVHAIRQGELRWADTAEAGRLQIGLDPAGETGMGDETVFAIRRGLKLIALFEHRGLNDEAHVVQLLKYLDRYRLPRETPVVALDRDGPVGTNVLKRLRGHLEEAEHKGSFELVSVRSSDRACRKPMLYDRVRDELTANLEAWLREGGAIVEDVKLAREMQEFEYRQHINGKLKVTPKEIIRKNLGYSPDRYDALALSVWEPLSLHQDGGVSPAQQAAVSPSENLETLHGTDPYAAANLIDPYASMGRR